MLPRRRNLRRRIEVSEVFEIPIPRRGTIRPVCAHACVRFFSFDFGSNLYKSALNRRVDKRQLEKVASITTALQRRRRERIKTARLGRNGMCKFRPATSSDLEFLRADGGKKIGREVNEKTCAAGGCPLLDHRVVAESQAGVL